MPKLLPIQMPGVNKFVNSKGLTLFTSGYFGQLCDSIYDRLLPESVHSREAVTSSFF